MSTINSKEYQQWLKTVKSKIRSAQVKAAVAVNRELIQFYWELGKMIVEEQKRSNWGNKIIELLSVDLKKEMPGVAGFSRSNLYAIRKFYQYFSTFPLAPIQKEVTSKPQIVPQVVGQLPWGHIRLLLGKVKEVDAMKFYMYQTAQNNWSRDVLALQIKSKLYDRQGKAITNFGLTLPFPQSELAQ